MDLKVKTCQHAACGREFGPSKTHQGVEFERRKFCSKACYAADASAKWADQAPSKDCEHCGEEFSAQPGRAGKQWEIRRFCSLSCGSKAKAHAIRTHLQEEVAWIVDHDHPESVARRVGYGSVDDLVNKLHRTGAHQLAEKLVRNLERYSMGAA